MSTPLTDSINALTAYANEVTGESDTTLSDAVHTLASGYGQSGYAPNGYTRLLYLESSGTQGIDTGKYGKLDSRFVIDFCFVPKGAYGYYASILGSDNPLIYATTTSRVDGLVKGTGYWKFANSSEKQCTYIMYERGTVEFSKDYGTYTNHEFPSLTCSVQIGATSITENPNSHLGLFCRGNNGTFERFAPCRIYEYWYYEGDTLIQHMIPVKRKSDNVLGMYDLVEDVFYTNIGTGTFIEGVWA